MPMNAPGHRCFVPTRSIKYGNKHTKYYFMKKHHRCSTSRNDMKTTLNLYGHYCTCAMGILSSNPRPHPKKKSSQLKSVGISRVSSGKLGISIALHGQPFLYGGSSHGRVFHCPRLPQETYMCHGYHGYHTASMDGVWDTIITAFGCASSKNTYIFFSMAISGTDSLEVPTINIRLINKAYVKEYAHRIWPNVWY